MEEEYYEDDGYGEYGAGSVVVEAPYARMEALGDDFNLLDRVRDFVSNFYVKMSQNKVGEVRNLYQKEWTNITNAYYKDVDWPRDHEVSNLCNNNEIFLLCYNELFYRHVFVNLDPQINHRFESWNNYRALFDAFLDVEQTGNLMLPSEWINDMVDEFLYQYQDFCRYKHDLSNLSEEEVSLLEENTNVWQTETVLGYLTKFVQNSNIVQLLESQQKGALHGMRVLQSLGYFSMFGLCRIHCLLADYRLAVNVLSPLDIDDKRALFTRLPACHINLFYYLGFSYLMMRRYADAMSVFSSVLMAHRGSRDRHGSYAEIHINKRYDQIRGLTAMTLALSPGLRVDQQVQHILSEKETDAMLAVTRREESGFEKMFAFACPKFIVPSIPDFSTRSNRHQSAFHLQLKWFMHEVRQQQALPTIRSYLKLYTSVPMEKLASFCKIPLDRFREHMLSLKVSANQTVHTDGASPLSGQRVAVNDIHFYVVGDMVFIEETRAAQRYSQFFLTHALKFQQAIDDLSEANAPRKQPAAAQDSKPKSALMSR